MAGGSNYVAVRFSNDGLPPFWGAALRTFAAALVIFTVVVVGAALVAAGVYSGAIPARHAGPPEPGPI